MNRYLTEKARKKHWWDWPVIIASGTMVALSVRAGINIYNGDSLAATVAATAVVAGVFALPLILTLRRRGRQSSAQRLAKIFDLCRDDSIPTGELDRRTSTKSVENKIKQLLAGGYLQSLAFDVDGRRLLLAGKPWNDTGHGVAPKLTGNGEFDAKLAEIRKLNDDIRDWKVSARIERIEDLAASIFQVISEKPDRADDARRFMSYYLPTTLKLLESYRLMEQQSFQGENIQVSRKKIEDVLDTMIQVMEKQQDRLFSHDVMDVETDITVLETLMSADGFSDKNRLPRQAREG